MKKISNKNKFIDFITKKRQAFLNHDYNNNNNKQHQSEDISFEDLSSIKYYNNDSKRHKPRPSRSYSADKSKQQQYNVFFARSSTLRWQANVLSCSIANMMIFLLLMEKVQG